jgi:nucleoside-diphosphate-sugar epimerase
MTNLNLFKNKRVLITGASGVIGYNLVKKLKESENCEIHINYLNEIDANLTELTNCIHHKFDICDLEKINQLPEFDIIFHCSGYGQPQKFCENPEKTFSLNTISLVFLSEKVKKDGQFIFLSTSEIYAEGNGNSEDSIISINPKNQRNCYILSKIFGEAFLSLNKRINYKNIRLCLCYGEGFKPSDKRVLCEFIFKAVDNNSIELMDDGSSVRSYIYISDCVEAILNIVENGKDNLYNLGGKELITIADLANTISKLTGCSVYLGKKENKMKNSPDKAYVDISKYESEFGVLNKTPLELGISRLIDWYKNYKN